MEELGFKVAVPRGVFQELKDLRKSDKVSHEVRVAIDVAFEFFRNKRIKKIRLGGGTIDEGLIAKGREGVHIATLDREVLRNVPNKVNILASKNRINVETGIT